MLATTAIQRSCDVRPFVRFFGGRAHRAGSCRGAVLVALAISLLVVACGPSAPGPGPSPAAPVPGHPGAGAGPMPGGVAPSTGPRASQVVVGCMASFAEAPLFVALEQALFERYGVPVALARYSSAVELGAALAEARVDVAASLDTPVAFELERQHANDTRFFLVDALNRTGYLRSNGRITKSYGGYGCSIIKNSQCSALLNIYPRGSIC